jgi:EpsI family protein
MTLPRVHAVLAFLLCVAAAAGAWLWKPTVYLSDKLPKIELEQLFPRQFGEWRVDTSVPVQLVSPDQQAVLNAIYSQTLSRVYVNTSGDRMMLSVAYGGDQSDATRAHRPEVCYPAQGFQIQRSQQAQLELAPDRSLKVRQLVARLGERIEPITYWTIVGDRVAISGTEQKLAQLKYSTTGLIPDGMLVRVSSIDRNADRAFRLQQQFIADMAASVAPAVQPRVTGQPI